MGCVMICRVKSCSNPVWIKKRKLCRLCYRRWYRNGHTRLLPVGNRTNHPPRLTSPPLPRIRANSEVTKNGCLEWKGSVTNAGYALIRVSPTKSMSVHRATWEAVNGPIPDGMAIHHKCHNKLCSEISHLELMDRREHGRMHRLAQM